MYYHLGANRSEHLDLVSGTYKGKPVLGVGKGNHRLLELLTLDFYRPQQLGALFAGLYPGENFNIYSSPDRVHQAIRRLRVWLDENKYSSKIQITNRGYKFTPADTFSIRLVLNRNPSELHQALWHKLFYQIGKKKCFTVKDAREQLGISETSFHRLANWALSLGLINRSGVGRSTKYLIAV